MASARLLLVCLVCATAAVRALPVTTAGVLPPVVLHLDTLAPATSPAPVTTTPAPPATTAAPTALAVPSIGVSIETNQRQLGRTQGGARVSSDVSTGGGASIKANITGSNFDIKKKVLAQTGSAARSGSFGDGGYVQGSKTTAGTISVRASKALSATTSQGKGATKGTAGTEMRTSANADFQGRLVAAPTKDGSKVADVEKRTAITAAIKQKASNSGPGAFKFENLAANEVQRFVKADLPPTSERISAASVVKQNGGSRGGALLSGNGAAQTQASTDVDSRLPTGDSQLISGVATRAKGGSKSSGFGDFQQDVASRTDVASTEGSLKLRSITDGIGKTSRSAQIDQSADSQGGVQRDHRVTAVLPTGEKFSSSERTTGRTRKGHQAGGIGPADFTVKNVAELELKVKKPDLNL